MRKPNTSGIGALGYVDSRLPLAVLRGVKIASSLKEAWAVSNLPLKARGPYEPRALEPPTPHDDDPPHLE
jgi:hypothetical protein